MAPDPLPPAIHARFAAPRHAGTLPADCGAVQRGAAGDPAEGGWVRLELALGDGRIAAARFAAYGCPWLIAAADWLCEQLTGSAWPPEAGGPLEWAERLGLPQARLTRLLLLEDALWAALQSTSVRPG